MGGGKNYVPPIFFEKAGDKKGSLDKKKYNICFEKHNMTTLGMYNGLSQVYLSNCNIKHHLLVRILPAHLILTTQFIEVIRG